MPWFEHVRIAVQALWANRLRSMLTMLGLIIGVSATILVLALGLALKISRRLVQELWHQCCCDWRTAGDSVRLL